MQGVPVAGEEPIADLGQLQTFVHEPSEGPAASRDLGPAGKASQRRVQPGCRTSRRVQDERYLRQFRPRGN